MKKFKELLEELGTGEVVAIVLVLMLMAFGVFAMFYFGSDTVTLND